MIHLLIWLVLAVNMVDSSKTASNFVRVSLSFQCNLANKVSNTLGLRVYVYDSSGYFVNATDSLVDGIRTKCRDNVHAVLSVAAQETIRTPSQYRQYSTITFCEDAIGLYVNPSKE